MSSIIGLKSRLHGVGPMVVTTASAISLIGCRTQHPSSDHSVRRKSSLSTKVNLPPQNESSTAKNDSNELDGRLVDRSKSATVLIGNFEGGNLYAMGSGFVVGDGRTVVTCKHVVTGSDDKADTCKLVFFSGTGKEVLLQVKPEDIRCGVGSRQQPEKYSDTDIAAIHLSKKVAEPLTVGETGELHETQAAWAIGYPAGTMIRRTGDEMPSPTIHVSRVERLQRKLDKVKVLQLNGSPTHGDSGGPVITGEGKVVGVLQAKEPGTGILYAVPTAVIRDIVAQPNGQASKTTVKAQPKMIDQFQASIQPDAQSKASKRKSQHGTSLVHARSILSRFEISDGLLDTFSAVELTILRNEPYARRGYIFRREELKEYYNGLSWYTPLNSNATDIETQFTSLERRNVEYIRNYQRSHDKQW